jgi:hypothetical protein
MAIALVANADRLWRCGYTMHQWRHSMHRHRCQFKFVRALAKTIGQYPRRPTQSGTVPLSDEQSQILNLRTKSGAVPHFPDHVLKSGIAPRESGTGTESGSQLYKMWNKDSHFGTYVAKFRANDLLCPIVDQFSSDQCLSRYSGFSDSSRVFKSNLLKKLLLVLSACHPGNLELPHFLSQKCGTVPQNVEEFHKKCNCKI